jgi:uracil phosphoribosyltransferase
MTPIDSQFNQLTFTPSEIEHRYGKNVHILSDPFALTLLTRLGHPDTIQPLAGRLMRQLYEYLLHTVVSAEFPRRTLTVDTRMKELDPRGTWTGAVVDTSAQVAVVAVARAGLQPSQIAFEALAEFMDHGVVRQDHVAAGRAIDDKGEVTGTVISSSKIGGSVEGGVVVVPDPMGATGGTVLALLDHYEEHRLGKPAKVIFMHLMVTPEYLKRIQQERPEVCVYAFRLDRGLSSDEVLQSIPGARWDEERGLTDKGYIVPGAGGVGELLNNSWV